MNAEKPNHDRDEATGTLLREAAQTFRPTDEMRCIALQRVMEVVQSAEEKAKPQAPSDAFLHRRPRWPWPAAGAAAALAAAAIIALALWPSPLTLAQVREAMNVVDWIHVRFDNGTERWISLTHGIRAEITPDASYDYYDDDIDFTDYRAGLEYEYVGRADAVYLRDASGFTMPATAWEATVGIYEGYRQIPQTERYEETIDGRRLVRFDNYITDALGKRLLITQIWADPATRLPVKIRRRVPGHEPRTNGDFKTGVYTFPESGPESIYDLGVRRDVKVLDLRWTGNHVAEQVMPIVEEIAAAEERFIDHYRVIEWKNDRPDPIEILYVSGEGVLKDSPEHPRRDYAPIRARFDHYFNMGPKHPGFYLPLPATAEEVLAWAATQTPVSVYLVDGRRDYSQSGPYPPYFTKADPPHVRVMRIGDPRSLPGQHWPNETFWPLAMRKLSGRVEVLPPSSEAPAGTIGIRMERGEIREDFHVDPALDFICIQHTYWEKHAHGWYRRWETTLGDFIQLPTGQWIATRKVDYRGGDPDRKISPSEHTYQIDITPLARDEFPPDIFDGKKLLEEAREKGYRIVTY
jgi:hypothetical protein